MQRRSSPPGDSTGCRSSWTSAWPWPDRTVARSCAAGGADGRPFSAPVDGCFLHGEFHFPTSRRALKLGHLAAALQ